MRKRVVMFRTASVMLMAANILAILLPVGLLAQTPADCQYDPASPSLNHARQNFKALNYTCADLEGDDFLKIDTLCYEENANAHVLMAAVYYAKLKDSKEKRHKVVEQFAKAFRSYTDWSGDLDIKSTEFISMMEQAKELVDLEIKKPEAPDIDTLAAVPKFDGEGKPWYKQWWAIGLGVGVVVGAVVLLGGGGDEAPDTTLADFPRPPAKEKSKTGK